MRVIVQNTHLSAITAQNLLGYVSTSFAHLESKVSAFFFFAKKPQACKID